MNQKIINVVLILVIFFLTGLLVYVLFFPRVEIPVQVNPNDAGKNQKACSQEAKVCPDGTSVSRTGPNCDFSPCQAVQNNTSLQTANVKGAVYANTDYGFKLNLPEEFEKYRPMVEKEPFEKGKSYVFIMLPTTYPNWVTENRETHEKISGYESMFAVEIWDKAVWDKELNSKECKETPYPACPYEPDVVGKNAKYVFAVSLGNGDPTPDLEQLELKIRANNAKIIKDTFELVK
jgi:hypothetical protein